MFCISRGAFQITSGCLSKPGVFLKNAVSVVVSRQKRNLYLGLKEYIEEVDGEEKNSLYDPWEISQLKSESDLIQAKALLYQVYIKEMGWMFAKDNPTGFRIETSQCGRKLLTDDLGGNSSWFGVKFQDNVVAVMRRVHRDSNGHLDLTRYESSRKPAIQRIISPSYTPKLAEVQRCAVSESYRGTNVTPCLFHYIFSKSLQQNYAVIGTSPVGKMKTFLASTLKFPIIDDNFLYSENIEGPSTCFFASRNDIIRALSLLEKLIQSPKFIKK